MPDRLKPSAYFDRVVDERVKFTLLTRDIGPYLVDRYSERKDSAEALSQRVNQAGTFEGLGRRGHARAPHQCVVTESSPVACTTGCACGDAR